MAPRWHVAQIGAREHYALARAAYQQDRLARLYTDVWAPVWLRALGTRRGPGARLGGRFHDDLHRAPVSHCTSRTVLRGAGVRWRRRDTAHHGFLRDGAHFARWLATEFERCLTGNQDALFAYNTGALEALRVASRRNVFSVVGQIDPAKAQYDRLLEEARRYPSWASTVPDVPQAYWERMQAEWRTADAVVVNSPWSRLGLLDQGVPEHKIWVAPLAYQTSAYDTVANARPNAEVKPADASSPLRVLFLGEVSLLKGIHYLFEAARALERKPIRFDVVGRLAAPRTKLDDAPSNLHIHGPVARREVPSWYARADVFVLPTISDGFALTQLEALANGVPVIATDACGDVVTPGVDGDVIPSGSADALVEALERFLSNPEQVSAMGAAARTAAAGFTLERSLSVLDECWATAMRTGA